MIATHPQDQQDGIAEILDPSNCVLLVIDMQNDAVHPDGVVATAGNDISSVRDIVPACQALMSEARRFDIPVVHVGIFNLLDGGSDSGAWLRVKRMVMNATQPFLEGTWGAEFCTECTPEPGEVVVRKYRSSAFYGTN